jgi:hypothetical protein
MFRGKHFRGRRWRSWQRRGKKRTHHDFLMVRLRDWWNRRQFYTFHKDEIITHADTCPSPVQVEGRPEQQEESEWNNESESEDDVDNVRDFEPINTWRDHVSYPSESDLETDEGDVLETIHEEASLEASPPRVRQQPSVGPSPPRQPSTPPTKQPLPPPSSLTLFQRNGAVESASGSLESMDSLASSQWDTEDDGSTLTPLVTNVRLQTNDAFFVEHVKFLKIQTQPRKVEEVYHNEDRGIGGNLAI